VNGVADAQSLGSTENCSLADSGHGLSEDSDHSRLALSTFRPRVHQRTAASDDTGICIVETAERRAAETTSDNIRPWTVSPSYGNNLATGCTNTDKLSRYKSRQTAADWSPSTTQLKRAVVTTAEPRRTGGRGSQRSLKKNNNEESTASRQLPPVPPDPRRSPRSNSVQLQRRAAAAEHNLSPVASSTDANVSDLESSTSGSFLVLGPHGTSKMSYVSEL